MKQIIMALLILTTQNVLAVTDYKTCFLGMTREKATYVFNNMDWPFGDIEAKDVERVWERDGALILYDKIIKGEKEPLLSSFLDCDKWRMDDYCKIGVSLYVEKLCLDSQ